jgi:hypothetical protein
MAHSYEELSKMTVARLREIADGIEHDALEGHNAMPKGRLLPALCEALGIEAHKHHEVVGVDKTAMKTEIRQLKVQRDSVLESGNKKELKPILRQIRNLKRKLHKATV